MFDLIILGNGMAGMTAAIYAKRANLNFKIVGRGEYDFGQIGEAILVENYPCVPSMSGFDLALSLHDQLTDIGVDIEENEVIKVSKVTNSETEHYYTIKYENGTIDETKTVIYALGAVHRGLSCEVDKGIPLHYCALCDGSFYKDKSVAVIGGGDVAFTQAEYLSKICKYVRILMCDRNVTAAQSTFERVSKIKNVEIHYDYIIDKIVKDPITNEISIFRKVPNDNNARLLGVSAAGIFVAIGMIPNTDPIDIYDVVNKQGYVIADENCESILSPGFFAAGDVRTKSVRQSITAASDGANAVQSVVNYLNSIK